MKRLFKYIGRKVDKRITNKIKDVRELIETVNDIANDNESKKVISDYMICVGVGLSVAGLLIKVDMISK